MDSTGIKAEGEGEWHARKHGGAKRRRWRKIHIGVDEQTLEIRAIEITGSNVGDAPMLPELLGQIADDVQIGSVTADSAYDTRRCHDAVADRGAHAVIPPRKNANTLRAPRYCSATSSMSSSMVTFSSSLRRQWPRRTSASRTRASLMS